MKFTLTLIAAAAAALITSGAHAADAKAAEALAKTSGCLACHTPDKKLVGPSYKEIANRYRKDKGAPASLAQKVKALGLDHVVLITDAVDENLALSSRNLPNVLVLEAGHADPVTLVSSKNVLVTRKAVAKLEELFA